MPEDNWSIRVMRTSCLCRSSLCRYPGGGALDVKGQQTLKIVGFNHSKPPCFGICFFHSPENPDSFVKSARILSFKIR